MTLIGKIFRPWDLESEGTTITSEASENSIKVPSAEIIPEIKTQSKSSSTRSKSEGNHVKSKSKPERNLRIKVKPKPKTRSDNTPSQNIKCGSSGPRFRQSDIMRNYFDGTSTTGSLPNTPSCCDPNSPADFDLQMANYSGSPCSSNIFLYPSTINELASLSRTELTAMGLLPMESLSSMKAKRQRPKRFHCPHCQVAFSNNGQLKGHIRIHTGERPYECEEEGCGKSFTRNEELTRHRRIHSGMRPFPCSYCGKKFGRKDHLKKHTRTHQRGMYNPGALIGFGNPFHPPLGSTSGFGSSNDLISFQSSLGYPPIPLPPSCIPPPNPHHYAFSL